MLSLSKHKGIEVQFYVICYTERSRSVEAWKPKSIIEIVIMKFYYVYILECADQSFYIGVSSDVKKRLEAHQRGLSKSSYTFSRRPVTLKWIQEFTNPDLAIAFEKQLKGWSRRKKLALINKDWDNLVKYSKNYTQYGRFSEEEGSSTGSD